MHHMLVQTESHKDMCSVLPTIRTRWCIIQYNACKATLHINKCWYMTIECASLRDYVISSVTAVLPPPGQRCGTVCLNSFGNQISSSDNSNDSWKRLRLVSWAAAPCVWTLRALTRNLLTYLLIWSSIHNTRSCKVQLHINKC